MPKFPVVAVDAPRYPELLDTCKTAKVMLATVHGRQVSTEFLGARDIILEEMTLQGVNGGATLASGVRVDANRNSCVESFLETTGTHLLFIDDDMQFPEGFVTKLLNDEADIACGLYFQRRIPNVYPHFYKYDSYGPDKEYGQVGTLFHTYIEELMPLLIQLPLQDLPMLIPTFKATPIDGGGTGCCLISRRVLETMKPPWFRTEGATNGDLQFFVKAKELGFSIVGDPGIVCTHDANRPIGIKTFFEAQEELTYNDPVPPKINSKEYWDKAYREEQGTNRTYGPFNQYIFDHLIKTQIPTDGSPLLFYDFGCGHTDIQSLIAKSDLNILYRGFDQSKIVADEVNRYFGLIEKIHVWVADIITDNIFGVDEAHITFSNSVIEHLEDPKILLDKMWKATKPGGLMFCGIPYNLPHKEHTMLYTWDTAIWAFTIYGAPIFCYNFADRMLVGVEKPK